MFYSFSADHAHPKWNEIERTIEVRQDAYNDMFHAMHPMLGCGKDNVSAEGAIREILTSHGYNHINSIKELAYNG
jgi:hypothetical protein